MATLEQVLKALDVLFEDQQASSDAKRQASAWLETFQKTSSAWAISDAIIRREDLPHSARIFAAQTFRQKIEYDLDELDVPSQESLRDSLLGLLYEARSGSKNMRTQLCLSLADLAIQLVTWEDPVAHMISIFGGNPEMLAVLLNFLRVLPEEMSYNSKIHLEKKVAETRSQTLLTNNGGRVFELLIGYLQVATDEKIKYSILDCIYSWLRSGNISTELIEASHIVDIAFQGLGTPSLFDVCADIVCEIIHRSSRKPPAQSLIEKVYPKLLPLNALLKQSADDEDVVRSLCRILVEAGECYTELIAGNLDAFYAIIDSLLFCAAYEELEIARITFGVWHQLTDLITAPERAAVKPSFVPVYSQLIDIILRHLRYPSDLSSWTAQERDEFRDFRHVMGDVLKDCVRVLGDEESLARPYALLRAFFGDAASGVPAPQAITDSNWPDIEAPLFSLRAMCREVSVGESRYLPDIMAMLPRLPSHPKIKYAAILVIGRYAEWTNEHPEMLSYQLDYVTKGFDQDRDTIAAASQTFRDLCKYCSRHLINLLEQLHPFYVRTLGSVSRDDRRQITEAVAHIIKAAPLERFTPAMQMYALPAAQRLHAFANLPGDATQDQIKDAILTINELATFFRFVVPEVPAEMPHPCVLIMTEMWPIIQQLYQRHGRDAAIAEALARLFRNSIESYKLHMLPLLPRIVEAQVTYFESTGLSCYLWVAGRCVRTFGTESREEGRIVCLMVERMTALVFEMVLIEEYHLLLAEFAEVCPNLFLSSQLVVSTFQCALFCLNAPSPYSVISVLRFLRDILTLATPRRAATVSEAAAAPLREMLAQNGVAFATSLFKGLVFTFARDREIVQDVAETILTECEVVGADAVVAFAQAAAETAFPEAELSAELRDGFLRKFAGACTEGKQQRLSSVLQDFAASYSRRNLINSRR
ncbi:Nuclear import receptor [Polyrhizophydium stewartii]|uniref:Nuclear import receptor n=1 Tax=Polyrhizophydium stewartii TaxID=2732419 RepID=A0ABR4NBP1_9FUNG